MTKIAQHNSPIAQPEGSSRNSGDVEKLIEKLDGYNITGPVAALLTEAAAILRSLAAEIAEMKKKDWDLENDALLRKNDELAAKLKRARKTLEGTLEALDQGYAAADNESFDEICAVIDAARKRARALIEELK